MDATTDERMDEVSSQGYAWGYIGSCVPFIADATGHPCPRGRWHEPAGSHAVSFVIAAVWWVVFTIPMLKNVEQTHYKPREDRAVSKAIHGVGATLKKMQADKTLRNFIIA